MAYSTVRVLQTLEHRCGYYAERNARNLVIDPNSERLAKVYDAVSHSGFRRAGDMIFKPHCRHCSACRATRIDVAAFTPDRSQRRCARRNADLRVTVTAARRTGEIFALYERYLAARHPGGGMDDPTPDDFESFLLSRWARTFFLESRLGDDLVAVAVCDRLASGISAVYSFFEPTLDARSLGTWCILRQIRQAADEGLPYVYLGYWLEGHPKMSYKIRFRPIEAFIDGVWRSVARRTRPAGRRSDAF